MAEENNNSSQNAQNVQAEIVEDGQNANSEGGFQFTHLEMTPEERKRLKIAQVCTMVGCIAAPLSLLARSTIVCFLGLCCAIYAFFSLRKMINEGDLLGYYANQVIRTDRTGIILSSVVLVVIIGLNIAESNGIETYSLF